MDAAPRNPLLVAIPPLILSAITAAILLYCKQILQPGLDIGSALRSEERRVGKEC